jgi:hypothetical protein
VSVRRRKTSSRPAPRRRPDTAADFWGRPAAEEPTVEPIRAADDPTPIVRSLGPPPLPGRDRVAEHYFAAVYEKAASLAVALAAASGLLAAPDED